MTDHIILFRGNTVLKLSEVVGVGPRPLKA